MTLKSNSFPPKFESLGRRNSVTEHQNKGQYKECHVIPGRKMPIVPIHTVNRSLRKSENCCMKACREKKGKAGKDHSKFEKTNAWPKGK